MPSTQFPHLEFYFRFHDPFDRERQLRDNADLIAVTRCAATAPNGKPGTWAFDITDGAPYVYVATAEQIDTLCTPCDWAGCMGHHDADSLLAALVMQSSFAALIDAAPIPTVPYDGGTVHFYLEYRPALAHYRRTDAPNYSTGNVLAVFPDTEQDLGMRAGGLVYDALGCALPTPAHAPIETMMVGPDYLGQFCLPVTEKMARILHPELFDILDPLQRQSIFFQNLNRTTMPLPEPRDPLADAINTRDAIDERKKKVIRGANLLPDDAPAKTRSLYAEAATSLQQQRDAANGAVREADGRGNAGTS